MTKTTKTFLTADQGRDLAQAVINLSNGLLMVDREGHATAVISAATAYADRVLRPEPSAAPAPSCDAPHCDCDTGEDCHANGAAGEVRPFDLRPDAVNVLPPGMRVELSSTTILANEISARLLTELPRGVVAKLRELAKDAVPGEHEFIGMDALLHPDLAARLDGLKAAVDALAERLERGPASGTKADPVPVKVTKVSVSYPFKQEEWTCSVDLRRVGPGRYVRDQRGRVAHVCSVITDTDGTSRLIVDVVDEEG